MVSICPKLCPWGTVLMSWCLHFEGVVSRGAHWPQITSILIFFLLYLSCGANSGKRLVNGVGLSTIIYTWLGCWSRELERGPSQCAKNLFTRWETWTSIGTDILVFRIPTVEVKPCLTKLMGNTFRTTARPWKPPTIHCILVVSTCVFLSYSIWVSWFRCPAPSAFPWNLQPIPGFA